MLTIVHVACVTDTCLISYAHPSACFVCHRYMPPILCSPLRMLRVSQIHASYPMLTIVHVACVTDTWPISYAHHCARCVCHRYMPHILCSPLRMLREFQLVLTLERRLCTLSNYVPTLVRAAFVQSYAHLCKRCVHLRTHPTTTTPTITAATTIT